MKKKLAFTLIAITIIQCSTLVYANTEPQSSKLNKSTQISTRAEQTEWKYRIYNGQQQKRLWSITYERWIGVWIPF